MAAIRILAHFDGRQIVLDEPYVLEPNAELVVTVLPNVRDDEREEQARFALENLARAYGDEEPDYPLELLKEVNPE